MTINRDEFYTVWELIHGKRWMVDRTYNGASFLPGSWLHHLLQCPNHKVLPQGSAPPRAPKAPNEANR